MNQGPRVFMDDKRTASGSDVFWVDRVSDRDWRYCKYCYRDVPTFQLIEGLHGSTEPVRILRCCWECGAGLDVLLDRSLDIPTTREGDDAEENE